MKYFEKLRELENAHIDLECLNSVVKMIDPHIHDLPDVDNSLTVVKNMLDLTNANIKDRFAELWNEIRVDSWPQDPNSDSNTDLSTDTIEYVENHLRFEHIVQGLMKE
jgi:hypothetical protein